jgi:hypothetical protein
MRKVSNVEFRKNEFSSYISAVERASLIGRSIG